MGLAHWLLRSALKPYPHLTSQTLTPSPARQTSPLSRALATLPLPLSCLLKEEGLGDGMKNRVRDRHHNDAEVPCSSWRMNFRYPQLDCLLILT